MFKGRWTSLLLAGLLLFAMPQPALTSQALTSGSLIGAAETVVIDALGQSSVGVQITGTWTATASFEGTIDNITWFAVTAYPIPSGASVTSAAANGQWLISSGGLRNVRVRASAYTSGTIVVWLSSALARSPSAMPSYLNFPAGTVLNFGGGDVTLTHTADALTLAGGQFLIPTGDTLGIAFAGDPDTGFYSNAANRIYVAVGGIAIARFLSGGFGFLAGTFLYWAPTIDGAGTTIVGEESAAVLQIGQDSATPVAQTLKGADAAGANLAGGNFTSAPGRGTGTGLGGTWDVATSPAGAAGSGQNALVSRLAVLPTGVTAFSPQDVAATPVEPTTTMKLFAYNKSVVDDGIVTLPAVTSNGYGKITVGTDAATYAEFLVGSTGTVTILGALVVTTADVAANADTDTKLCLGTAATQEPLQIKNRLGATKILNILFWYD